jgi:hypothetical protein
LPLFKEAITLTGKKGLSPSFFWLNNAMVQRGADDWHDWSLIRQSFQSGWTV